MIDARTRRNFLAYFSYHGVRYLFPLIVTPFLAHALGTSSFADFIIWNSSVWTSTIFVEFGFFLHAVHAVSSARTDEQMNITVANVVTAKLLLAPVAVLTYLTIAYLSGITARQPLSTIFGIFAVLAYGNTFAWYFQGLQRGVMASVLEGVPQALQCALVFAFIRAPDDVMLVAFFQTSAALISVFVAGIIVLRERGFVLASFARARQAIQAAAPYFIQRCCFTAYSAATPLIVSALSTPAQAGFYGIGDKVNAFLTGLSIPLTQLLLPILSRRLAENGTDWNMSVKSIAALSGLTAAAAATCFAFAHPAFLLLFGEAYLPSVFVAQWFCLAAPLMAYHTAIATFVIVPANKAKVLAVASGCALACSMLFQLILVPSFGAVGSAIARVVAEFLTAIILTIVAWQVIGPWKRISIHRGEAP